MILWYLWFRSSNFAGLSSADLNFILLHCMQVYFEINLKRSVQIVFNLLVLVNGKVQDPFSVYSGQFKESCHLSQHRYLGWISKFLNVSWSFAISSGLVSVRFLCSILFHSWILARPCFLNGVVILGKIYLLLTSVCLQIAVAHPC